MMSEYLKRLADDVLSVAKTVDPYSMGVTEAEKKENWNETYALLKNAPEAVLKWFDDNEVTDNYPEFLPIYNLVYQELTYTNPRGEAIYNILRKIDDIAKVNELDVESTYSTAIDYVWFACKIDLLHEPEYWYLRRTIRAELFARRKMYQGKHQKDEIKSNGNLKIYGGIDSI